MNEEVVIIKYDAESGAFNVSSTMNDNVQVMTLLDFAIVNLTEEMGISLDDYIRHLKYAKYRLDVDGLNRKRGN